MRLIWFQRLKLSLQASVSISFAPFNADRCSGFIQMVRQVLFSRAWSRMAIEISLYGLFEVHVDCFRSNFERP
jgi:hypothetical protein